jgi:hypothetical protein
MFLRLMMVKVVHYHLGHAMLENVPFLPTNASPCIPHVFNSVNCRDFFGSLSESLRYQRPGASSQQLTVKKKSVQFLAVCLNPSDIMSSPGL